MCDWYVEDLGTSVDEAGYLKRRKLGKLQTLLKITIREEKDPNIYDYEGLREARTG